MFKFLSYIIIFILLVFGNISLTFARCIGVKTPTADKFNYWCSPKDCDLISLELKHHSDSYILNENWDANLDDILKICSKVQEDKNKQDTRKKMYEMGKTINEKAKKLKDFYCMIVVLFLLLRGLLGINFY